MLEVGKLYVCEEYFLMLFTDPDIAAAASAADYAFLAPTTYTRSYVEKNIPLLVLNSKEEYVEVLAGDKKGWIIYQDWLEIKELP